MRLGINRTSNYMHYNTGYVIIMVITVVLLMSAWFLYSELSTCSLKDGKLTVKFNLHAIAVGSSDQS